MELLESSLTMANSLRIVAVDFESALGLNTFYGIANAPQCRSSYYPKRNEALLLGDA